MMRGIPYIALLLVGCSGQGVDQEDDAILAEVDGRKITLAEYRAHVERVPDSLKSEFDPQRYLQAIIDEELLLQETKRRGLDRSSELARHLQQQRRMLTMRALYQHEGIERPDVSETELRSYFARSPYSRQVRFSLLMVKTSEQILPLLEKLEAGADFEALSLQHSQDPRILARGADMGYHRWGETMPPHVPITQKAFTMKAGEIAGPMKVADGYFLIKLTDIHPIAFEEERETIEQLVIQERLGRQLKEYYDRLRERYDLQHDPTGLEALVDAVTEFSASEGGAQSGPLAHPLSAADSSSPVLRYKGGTLTLVRCLQLLRASRQPVSPDLEGLRQQLGQQVCRQILVPLEIQRLGLVRASSVQEGLERARREFMVRKLQAQIVSQMPPVNVNALRLYFENNKERYVQPARVEVRRMLVPDPASGEKIVEQLRAGRDIPALVDRFVPVTYGSSALEEDNPVGRALRAEEGSIHGPLATSSGYIILQILRRYEARLLSLEEAREQVTDDLARDRVRSLFQEFTEDLRTRYAERITIHQDRLQKLAFLSNQGRRDGE